MPEDVDVVVIHSGEPRRLAGSAYAERRRQCEAAEVIVGPLRSLLDPTDVDVIGDPVLRRRARHVVTENARVRAFAEALDAGDLAAAGRLMRESHASLAADFEVSTPALDALVARISALGGVHGARMTGGGFGGCIVALTRARRAVRRVDRARWRGRPSDQMTSLMRVRNRSIASGSAPPTRTDPGHRPGAPARPRQLFDVPLTEGIRLARREHEIGPAGCRRREIGLRVASAWSANTFVTPIAINTDEPYVSPAMLIHGRRQIGTNAAQSERFLVGDGKVAAHLDARPRRPRPASARERRRNVGDRARRTRVHPQAGRLQRVGILPPVLLITHDDEVRRQRHDRRRRPDPSCPQRAPGRVARRTVCMPTGATPQCSSVSVTEGTRLTIRKARSSPSVTCGRAARSSWPRTPRRR